MNILCVICADLLAPNDEISSNTCGHIFHYTCIVQWIERSKTCPQCRKPCTERYMKRLFLTVSSGEPEDQDLDEMQNKIETLTSRCNEAVKSQVTLKKEVEDLQKSKRDAVKVIAKLEAIHDQDCFTIKTFQKKVEELKNEKARVETMHLELTKLRTKVHQMRAIDAFINCAVEEVEELLNRETDARTLAFLVANLKRELTAAESKKNNLRTALNELKYRFKQEIDMKTELEEKLHDLESENFRLKREMPSTSSRSTESSRLYEPQAQKRRLEDDTQGSCKDIVPRKQDKKESENDSPYLRVQSSIVGLTPIMKTRPNPVKPKPLSENLQKLSIFQTGRVTKSTKIPVGSPMTSRYGFDGMGGIEKKENFPDFPIKNDKFKIENRLKKGVLKNNLVKPKTSPPESARFG